MHGDALGHAQRCTAWALPFVCRALCLPSALPPARLPSCPSLHERPAHAPGLASGPASAASALWGAMYAQAHAALLTGAPWQRQQVESSGMRWHTRHARRAFNVFACAGVMSCRALAARPTTAAGLLLQARIPDHMSQRTPAAAAEPARTCGRGVLYLLAGRSVLATVQLLPVQHTHLLHPVQAQPSKEALRSWLSAMWR